MAERTNDRGTDCYLQLPNGERIDLAHPQMRRLLSMARKYIYSKEEAGITLVDTELDLKRILAGERVKF